MKQSNYKNFINAGVIVAALGYFVDIYDLLLFSIVRTPSLKSLGYLPEQVKDYGLALINIQMVGMLVGGVFWGVLGDKKGRLSVLFGSIILYSLANIANGFVNDITTYAILRFIAGFGLAGELGAGIALVSESFTKENRGWGTTIVATIGVSGAVFAGLVSEYFDWRSCYFLGGALGLALLLLRIGVYESGMFERLRQNRTVEKGNFVSLFTNKKRFVKYMLCILIGLPTWYTIGLLVSFSPEFSHTLGIQGEITGKKAIMYSYMGITLGDFACGLLSQLIKSRRKAVFIFLLITAIGFASYFTANGASSAYFYFTMALMGIGTGFWAVIVTNAAEQFGTNIRATVSTTVPNFIRGSLPIITLFYSMFTAFFMSENKPVAELKAAALLAFFITIIPMIALYFSEETFGKELDYIE